MPRIFTMPRDQQGSRIKGWIQSNVRFGPVLDINVCNHYGRHSIEGQVQSLSQDQTVSWIRIVNGVDKFVREAMPIQEEEKASEKPAAKARPILTPPSTSGWEVTPIEQRQQIDIESQESNDPCCFQVLKFSTRLLRHNQQVYREGDGAVHYDQVIDECKRKAISEMKKDFVNAPHWSIEKWVSVLAKGGGQKKRFQYCLSPNYPHQFLYLGAIQGHSGSIINPAVKDNVLLPEGISECIHFITSETEKN